MIEIAEERPASALTHEGAKKVLDLAAQQPVLIRRRGGAPDEVLLSYDRYAAWRRFDARVVMLARALEKGAEQMHDLDGMLWTKVFSVDDRKRMLAELVEAARSTTERDDPSVFNAAWKGWAESSEIMADPVRLARLTAPAGSARIPLPRP